MNMIICRGQKTKRAEGRKKQPGKKFEQEGPVLKRAKCVGADVEALVGRFAPLLDGDMDALKSAGRAIIRSPSIAKQSWAASKHKSECTDVLMSVLSSFSSGESILKQLT